MHLLGDNEYLNLWKYSLVGHHLCVACNGCDMLRAHCSFVSTSKISRRHSSNNQSDLQMMCLFLGFQSHVNNNLVPSGGLLGHYTGSQLLTHRIRIQVCLVKHCEK